MLVLTGCLTLGSKEEDEDAPLPRLQVNALKEQFWRRYHLCLTPEEWPNDKLVSKLWKALDKRTLEVTDLWTVRSMLHQKTTSSKRRRLAENLYLQDDDEDTAPEVGTDAPSCFNRMKVYFMALAIVGAAPLLRRLRRPLVMRELYVHVLGTF